MFTAAYSRVGQSAPLLWSNMMWPIYIHLRRKQFTQVHIHTCKLNSTRIIEPYKNYYKNMHVSGSPARVTNFAMWSKSHTRMPNNAWFIYFVFILLKH